MRPSAKPNRAVLVGVAGSTNAFSLSLYNLKAYAYADPDIRRTWHITVIQHPLLSAPYDAEKLEELAQRIVREKPDVVGFSCYMWNVTVFRELARMMRTAAPGAKILFGGPEMATDYLRSGQFDDFAMDYCISGEGERTFVALLAALRTSNPDLSHIPGLAFRPNDAEPFTVNEKREPFKSLLEIPSPYLSGVVDDDVLFRKKVEANIETQRGCTLRCSYCVYHKDMNRISYNSVERTIQEVAFVINKGVKAIRFVDANFSSDLNHAKAVMRGLIRHRFETRLMFELIPGFIDEELAALFAEFRDLSDVNDLTLGVGVQSINLDALRIIHRAIKLDKFETTFALLKRYGLYAKIDVIIGLPGETLAAIERTLEYMLDALRGNQAHLLCCHVMRGLPGTQLLDIAQQYGMVFSSRYEPHEMYESPALPRADMLRTLRRTAVIFRLVNHEGWANREFVFQTKSHSTSVHDAFFAARDRLGISNVALLDRLVAGLMTALPPTSNFVQEDFPYAETWWWSLAKLEVGTEWLVEFLDGLPPERLDAPSAAPASP